MKYVGIGAQMLLGLIFFVFGLNGFFHFLPQPPLPETAMGYLSGLMAAPYFFPLLKGTEVIAGIALLSNRFAALALVVLAPILIQIFLFHAVLTPGLSNSVLPVAMIVLALVSAYSHREKYAPLLRSK